ncbi:unnamed protein product [Ceratitis capitata]|uniref:(Mediterranean fruit fly) hypothetical protein n=1 Tax=Ceratitis capitata TaxID=7213 RepID=A0A811V922_CERCA|nr:unnamed protein product [Ceratitis capitata]
MNRETIDAEKYTLLQLKAWCTTVGINASGAKASLAARLNDLSAEARGLFPSTSGPSSRRSDLSDNSEESDHDEADEEANLIGKGEKSTVNDGEKNVAVSVQKIVADNGSQSSVTSNKNNEAKKTVYL